MNLESFLKNKPDITLINVNGNKYIKFDKSISEGGIIDLLNQLWNGKYEFTFQDMIYPSISDQGAYFSYSTKKTNQPDYWSMTFGNHGWSGGIYHISTKTISKQILNLIKKSHIEKIKASNVAFFSHYKVQPKEKSLKKELEINDIHE